MAWLHEDSSTECSKGQLLPRSLDPRSLGCQRAWLCCREGAQGSASRTRPAAVSAILVVVAPLLQDLVLALPILLPRRTRHSQPSLCWLRATHLSGD